MQFVANMIIDFVLLFSGIVIGIWFSAKTIASKFQPVSAAKLSPKVPLCVVEMQEGNYYLYDQLTHAFLCQAESMDELASNLKTNKHIGIAFVMHVVDNRHDLFWFINGEVRDANISKLDNVG